jgi:hypothetical protein
MPQVITNAAVTIGGVDLSQHITKVTLSATRAEIETTTFGNVAKRRVGGLQDNSVSIDFNNDYTGVANVESTLYPLLGSTAQVTVKPNGTTTGTANPAYTFNVLVTEWMPLDAQVGELTTASITWPVDGTVAKATA